MLRRGQGTPAPWEGWEVPRCSIWLPVHLGVTWGPWDSPGHPLGALASQLRASQGWFSLGQQGLVKEPLKPGQLFPTQTLVLCFFLIFPRPPLSSSFYQPTLPTLLSPLPSSFSHKFSPMGLSAKGLSKQEGREGINLGSGDRLWEGFRLRRPRQRSGWPLPGNRGLCPQGLGGCREGVR